MHEYDPTLGELTWKWVEGRGREGGGKVIISSCRTLPCLHDIWGGGGGRCTYCRRNGQYVT